jgi:hypothetical protein
VVRRLQGDGVSSEYEGGGGEERNSEKVDGMSSTGSEEGRCAACCANARAAYEGDPIVGWCRQTGGAVSRRGWFGSGDRSCDGELCGRPLSSQEGDGYRAMARVKQSWDAGGGKYEYGRSSSLGTSIGGGGRERCESL